MSAPGKTLMEQAKSILKTATVIGGLALAGLSAGPLGAQEDPSMEEKLADYSIEEIQADEALKAYAEARGQSAFGQYCSRCHGENATGQEGIPNLTDKDWLWGGDLYSIYDTILYGIRSEHFVAKGGYMPNLPESNLLTEEEAETIANFVLELDDDPDYLSPAGALYTKNCAGCHGAYGEGYTGLGAPRLNDDIWFYGGGYENILNQIKNPKHGVMPSWEDKLPPELIKSLAIYVHSLGGGED